MAYYSLQGAWARGRFTEVWTKLPRLIDEWSVSSLACAGDNIVAYRKVGNMDPLAQYGLQRFVLVDRRTHEIVDGLDKSNTSGRDRPELRIVRGLGLVLLVVQRCPMEDGGYGSECNCVHIWVRTTVLEELGIASDVAHDAGDPPLRGFTLLAHLQHLRGELNMMGLYLYLEPTPTISIAARYQNEFHVENIDLITHKRDHKVVNAGHAGYFRGTHITFLDKHIVEPLPPMYALCVYRPDVAVTGMYFGHTAISVAEGPCAVFQLPEVPCTGNNPYLTALPRAEFKQLLDTPDDMKEIIPRRAISAGRSVVIDCDHHIIVLPKHSLLGYNSPVPDGEERSEGAAGPGTPASESSDGFDTATSVTDDDDEATLIDLPFDGPNTIVIVRPEPYTASEIVSHGSRFAVCTENAVHVMDADQLTAALAEDFAKPDLSVLVIPGKRVMEPNRTQFAMEGRGVYEIVTQEHGSAERFALKSLVFSPDAPSQLQAGC